MKLQRLDCDEKTCTCPVCGKTLQLKVPATRAFHSCPGKPRLGLGDMVSAALSFVGITKSRAQAVAKAVGAKDCGCNKRQQKLNELGAKLGLPPGSG